MDLVRRAGLNGDQLQAFLDIWNAYNACSHILHIRDRFSMLEDKDISSLIISMVKKVDDQHKAFAERVQHALLLMEQHFNSALFYHLKANQVRDNILEYFNEKIGVDLMKPESLKNMEEEDYVLVLAGLLVLSAIGL